MIQAEVDVEYAPPAFGAQVEAVEQPPPEVPPGEREAPDGREAPDEREALAREVYGIIGRPVDHWAVVATMESIGWRDVDARQHCGADDLFVLGRDLYPRCMELAREERRPADDPIARAEQERGSGLGRFARYYGRGLLFAAPMAGQIVVILWLTYSLWAWLYFSEAQATVVAIGTLLSFVVTGGFVQGIGREGIHYMSNRQGHLAETICLRLVGQGTLAVLGFGLAAFLANLVFPYYPMHLMGISMTYFVLLAELWLCLSVLYVYEALPEILLVTLLGVVPVHLVMTLTGWGIYAAHWLGLALALLLAAGYGAFRLRRTARDTAAAQVSATLPQRTVQRHVLAPYFVYGVIYFSFLFVDRVLAWSTIEGGEPPPYVIWFRTAYELGMDWALISLLLTLAALQYTVHDFAERLLPRQQGTTGLDVGDYNRFFRRLYGRHLVLLIVLGLVSVVVTYYGILELRRFDYIPEVREFFSDPVTYFVYFWAAVGYLLVAVGLFNGLYFFTLARPEFVLRALGPALLANVAVGYLASRWISYEYAVLGLVAGGAVFAVLTTRYARRFFGRFDYYYYSAY